MKNLISFKFASSASILVYGLLLIFHIALSIGAGLFDFIPLDIVWGGKMKTKEQLIGFELVAFFVVLFCLFLTLVKTEHIKIAKLYKVSHYSMWFLFAYFLLNTAGNLASKTSFEKSMSIATILLSICALRLALEKKS
jgi:hypothetical protein